MITSLAILSILIGFIVGLGAVTVIDIHGFLGRNSSYWTVATTRTHKVTKPLIWIGTFFFALGVLSLYEGQLLLLQSLVLAVMILNGLFLSFRVSPHLLQKEKKGQDHELLSKNWQRYITLSFILSFISWWGSVVIFALYFLPTY